jgi:hypothetical protein
MPASTARSTISSISSRTGIDRQSGPASFSGVAAGTASPRMAA